MKPAKAVITAASPAHRTLALQNLVDRDGCERSVLEILLREIYSAGIDNICVVIHPGDGESYRQAVRNVPVKLSFVEQHEQLGYGHALALAHQFIEGEPFLHTVCDHLFISKDPECSCARQLVETTVREGYAMSAVQSTPERDIHHYGAVAGTLKKTAGAETVYQVRDVIEKPTPTEAEQKLIVPGLRAGQYLTFFGMHVLPPFVIERLQDAVAQASGTDSPNLQLSPILAELARREHYGALIISGERHHISMKYGLLYTQLALALHGSEKTEVLEAMLDLMAKSHA